MAKAKAIPKRSEVAPADMWNLAKLFRSDDAWEKAFKAWEADLAGYEQFRGRLAESAQTMLQMLQFDQAIDRTGDRLGTYAFLRSCVDLSDAKTQDMRGRFSHVASRAGQLSSYIRPEIMAIAAQTMQGLLADPSLAEYRLVLERILRYKPHTLSVAEEKLLAMQGKMSGVSNQAFRQLNDNDLKFGTVKLPNQESFELSHSSFARCLQAPDVRVRKNAFHQYYKQYESHAHTLAALLEGSVQRDVYYSEVRGFKSALEGALFPDQVPVTVYDNLISTIRASLPVVHRYYDVRRRALGLKQIHQYDTYVPIVSSIKKVHTWDQAADAVIESLAPLGKTYLKTLEKGLRGDWCDRYENQGKQSGAFSAGSYDGDPYILMNFQKDVFDHVFTLAHEAGHSMHSYFSTKNQPFQYHQYTIFVAEVASTFNEQLLSEHLLKKAKGNKERAYLLNREIDDIRATVIRQTMFAEFEKTIHHLAETGAALTLDRLKEEYHKLLVDYFGPHFALDDALSLECLRIPHFYRAFYVYKYATGMSAAIALANRVLTGRASDREAYLNFLSGGCSKEPLELLKDAGVDMSTPAPIQAAMEHFAKLVDELETLVG